MGKVQESKSLPAPPQKGCGSVLRCLVRGSRAWLFVATLVSGIAALGWLLLRTGTKPSRLAYPCQQVALSTASAAFGVPVVLALLALRRNLAAGLRTPTSKIVAGVATALGLGVLASAAFGPAGETVLVSPPADHHPPVFVVNDVRGVSPGRFGGVDDLVTLMGIHGLKWHRSDTATLTAGPSGMIEADDVVLIKINAQWPRRGGTNTDVLRGIIRRIVEHPDGFIGEVIVADNGQGWGQLDRAENNAEDHGQSPQDVVDDFVTEGWQVATERWDDFRYIGVDEYAAGDSNDGYVVNAVADPETAIRVSYPKFQSAFGTHISYKHGVWSPGAQTYDPERLVVINVPVFKTHSIYGITASVKNHMGVVTQSLATDSHDSVGRGGMGSVLADVRLPDLTILDCIHILARPGWGPRADYDEVNRRDQLLAGTDPIALDVWATKQVMIPQIIANGFSYLDYYSPSSAEFVG